MTDPFKLLNETPTRELELCTGIQKARFGTVGSSIPYFVNAALNATLAVATTFANLLVLLAMRHVKSIRLPSKLLLCSLVLTDLGAGLIVHPQRAMLFFGKAIDPSVVQCNLFKSYRFNGSTLTFASLLSLTAIFVDRYAALFYHLNYKQTVTTRRVCAALILTWLLSSLVASISFWNTTLWGGLAIISAIVAIPITSVMCLKIYRRLQALQIQPRAPGQAQQQAGNTLKIAKYRRSASTVMWVYALFLICYAPYWGVYLVNSVIGDSVVLVCVREFNYTLLLFNSFLNPFAYCFNVPEIRTKVLKELRKLFCRGGVPRTGGNEAQGTEQTNGTSGS